MLVMPEVDQKLQHQQQTQQLGRAAVIQALEEVDASEIAGSKRDEEKTWIRNRLARKRSAAEIELQRLQQGQTSPAVRALCVCGVCDLEWSRVK